jgi:hypothetical protein
LFILLVILFVGFIRFRLLDMPLERDEGEYAYAGQLILQGVPPYELACNLKLPGTYYAYALGMAVFGQTTSGVHLTVLVVDSLLIIFVFLLGRELFDATAGAAAGASFGLMSVSPAVLGMAGHANFFVLLFALPATLLLARGGEKRTPLILLLSGLLYGTAFLMKQQGVFVGLFGIIAILLFQLRQHPFKEIVAVGRRSLANTGANVAIFAAAFVLPFALICLFFYTLGIFSKFWFWTVTYARIYETALPWSYGASSLSGHLDATFGQSALLWALAVGGAWLGLRRPEFRRQTVFALLFWVFSFLATASGLYFRRHYFILLLPAFALLAGLFATAAQKTLLPKINARLALWTPLGILVLALGWNLACQNEVLFKLSPERTSQIVYPGNPFVEAPKVADYLRAHAPGTARIAVIGSEPEIYFHSRLRSATAFIYTYDLMQPQPYAVTMQQEMEQEIESNQPEYLVYVSYENSWIVRSDSNQGIFDWFDKYTADHYEQVGLVQTTPDLKTECYWDEAAAKISEADIEHLHLTLFRRKGG